MQQHCEIGAALLRQDAKLKKTFGCPSFIIGGNDADLSKNSFMEVASLIALIPRMEPVAKIIAYQGKLFNGGGGLLKTRCKVKKFPWGPEF